jgi:hypothetical protein
VVAMGGGVLMALGTGMAVVDVLVTHLAGVANRAAAAATDGAAAAKRDVEKRRAYNRLEPNGYCFTPFSVEAYGRLGMPAIALLGRLGVEAVGSARLGAVSLPLCGRRLGNLVWACVGATVSCTGKHWGCGLVGLGGGSCWALTA